MSDLRIRSFQPEQSPQWLTCGWRLLRRRPGEALRPAIVFALCVMVMRLIPVLGDIVLLLLLPTIAASYTLHAHFIAATGNKPRPVLRNAPPIYKRWAHEIRLALFGAWSKHENVLPLIVVGLALVAVGLVAYIVFHQVAGEAALSTYAFFDLTALQMARLLLAYAAGTLLWIFVTAMLLWTLPLFALRDMGLDDALVWNARAIANNAGAILTMLGILAAGLLPAALIETWSAIGHFVVLWLTLTVLASVFGFGAYCSFRLVFADPQQAPRAAPRPGNSSRRSPAR
jgi:hypothetical protein